MKQHRLIPSALIAATTLAATACTAATIESAAATETPSAAVPPEGADARVTEVVVTAPMPATTQQRTTEPPATSSSTTTAPPTTAPPTTAPPTTAPPTTAPPTTAPPTTAPPTKGAGVLVTPTIEPGPSVTIAPVFTSNPCDPIGPVPDSAAGLMTIDLDATGDGTADDTATSYLDGDTGQWIIRLATAGGAVSEQVVDGVGPGFVEVLGAVEFGQSGADSFLATIGSSPSMLRIGLFGADATGCLVRHGGDALDFAVGGSIAGFSGVACGSWDGGHYIESLGANEVGPGSYNVYGTSVHLDADGDTFAENGTHLFGVTAEEAQQIARIDCPGFES